MSFPLVHSLLVSMLSLLDLFEELFEKELLPHLTCLDQQFLGSTCTIYRKRFGSFWLMDTKRIWPNPLKHNPKDKPTNLFEQNSSKAFQWVIQTGREEWILNFLVQPGVRYQLGVKSMSRLLASFHKDKTSKKILSLVHPRPDTCYPIAPQHVADLIWEELFQVYNAQCNDALLMDENNHPGFSAYMKNWYRDKTHLFHVLQRDDFVSNVLEEKAFCGRYFRREKHIVLAYMLQQLLRKDDCHTYRIQCEHWNTWFKRSGSPYGIVLYPVTRLHDKLPKSYHGYCLLTSLASEGQVTLDTKFHLNLYVIKDYLPVVIRHDDIQELESLLAHAPHPLPEDILRKLRVCTISHMSSQKITKMTQWCIERGLLKFSDFGLSSRACLRTSGPWQDLARQFPGFGMDK